MSYTLSAAALLALFSGICSAEELAIRDIPEPVIKHRLESGQVKYADRQATIRSLFQEAGCQAEDQRLNKHFGNVVCTLPGTSDSTIVVGGHFDFVERGQGIVDDWSGASLLPSLHQALSGVPRRHTFIFVAFAAEEDGLVGSSRYVKNLTADQKAHLRAFINLECLGLGPPKVWVHRSTPVLVTSLNDVAKAIGVTLKGVDVDRVGDDDTHPFLNAHIPVISIHSLTQETLPILHTRRDRLDAIHFDDYYAAYRLVAYYLAHLDSVPN